MQGSLGTSFFCQICCPTEDNFKKQRKARICNQRSSGARRCSTLLDVCSTCWVFKLDVARRCSTLLDVCSTLPGVHFRRFCQSQGQEPTSCKIFTASNRLVGRRPFATKSGLALSNLSEPHRNRATILAHNPQTETFNLFGASALSLPANPALSQHCFTSSVHARILAESGIEPHLLTTI